MAVSVCQCAVCSGSANLGDGSAAVSTGAKWGDGPSFGTAGGTVTWSYASLNIAGRTQFDFTLSFLPSGYLSEIQRAFDAWEAVANIQFEQVADGAGVDIRLGGGNYDGAYGVLGYATWWYSGTQLTQADIFFDAAEPWTIGTSGISVYSVAVHEIGHAIGLAHQTGVTAIMNPYNANLQSLQAADIASIQAIYGAAVDYGAIYGTANNDTLNGTSGADTIYGQAGNDTISGGDGADRLYGEGGNDSLSGGANNDTLDGGDNNDTLVGGAGRDSLTGGAGADRYVFTAVSDSPAGSNRDVINGFSSAQGDKIDLSGVDASTLASGSQLFAFVGTAAFSGIAGQLRFASGILSGDVNGDKVADFEISLPGVSSLQASDFTALNQAPTVSAGNVTPVSSAPIAASSLFSVSDANGDTMTKYQLWDHTGAATSGKFYVNGVAQGVQVNIDVTAAQLAQTVFQPGTSGSDLLYVRAFDGVQWSDWDDFYVSAAPAQTAPEITVLGNAANIADGDTTPASADHTDFGSATQGGSAVVRTFTVRNDGNATLTLGTPSLPTGFTLVEGLSVSLAAGATDTFQVRLDTSVLGTKSGEISFANNDGNESPFNFSITGTVAAAPTPAPEITVLGNSVNIADGDTTPASADHTDFGSTTQGGSAVVRTFTVRNDGDATLTLGTPSLPTGFTLVEGLSASLAAGASDTFQVRLDTGVVGTKSGQISFTNNDGNESPFNFSITGTVASPPQVNVAPVVSAPNVTPADSGPIAASSLFTVSDANGDTMTKYQLWDHTGAATSGKFYVNGVAQGVQVNIDVTAAQLAQTVFQPGTSGSDLLYVRAFDGALWSDWDDFTVSAAPAQTAPEITVLGNGASITDGDTTPASADHTDFGGATQGGSAVVRTFTVRNDGNATLTLGTPSLPTGFTLVEGLSGSLAAGASDTFQVRLDTGVLGTKSGQISFTNNDGNENPFNFSITGTVAAAPTPEPEITLLGNGASIADGDTTPASADHTDFGSTTQGGSAVVRTFTVRNDGTATLTLDTPDLPTGFTLVEGLSASLAPGASDTFQVRLDTTTVGTKSGQISIANNDANEDSFDFSITGTVSSPPQVNVAPVVSAPSITAPSSAPMAAASLFSVNDANGDAITIYQLWDHTFAATSGKFYVNGVAQPYQQNIDVTPAQLAQTVFQPGTSGSDLLYVRVFDGALWSDWDDFTVAAPAPLMAPPDEDEILATRWDADAVEFI